MNKVITTTVLATALSFTLALDASAWTRGGTKTGPNGTSTSASATASCQENPYGANCSREAVRAGPNGNSTTHQNSATCMYGTTCVTESETTGPGGNSVSRGGAIVRN